MASIKPRHSGRGGLENQRTVRIWQTKVSLSHVILRKAAENLVFGLQLIFVSSSAS